jgi:sugar phosphate isomerase/epimerase
MQSRRGFLTTVAAGLGSTAVGLSASSDPRRTDPREAQQEIKTALNGPLGLQLWSLREYLPKDLSGTLTKIRAMGFTEVEGAGLWNHTVAELRAALDAAGLRCQSAHMGFERLRDDLSGAFAEAKALGATSVVCPWIPHGDTFTREDAVQAAEAFDKFGAAATKEGLHFGYHCHGYDMAPSSEGTLFDTIAGATDPNRVAFQIDVFHAFHGGGDPVKLIERYKSRVVSAHLKDLKKGSAVKTGAGTGTADDDVPVGSGQIDMPAVLRAAVKAGVKIYYVEDESADPWGHIPQSVKYLQQVAIA